MTTTKRPELGELKLGQKVMVRRSANDMRGRKSEDRYIPAVVTKVGRVWVDLARADLPEKALGYGTWRMRMDTQCEGSQFSGSNDSFATLDQHDWDQTQAWAREVLTEQGLRILDRNSPWYGREVDLAQLLVSLPAENPAPVPFTVHHLDGTSTTTQEDK